MCGWVLAAYWLGPMSLIPWHFCKPLMITIRVRLIGYQNLLVASLLTLRHLGSKALFDLEPHPATQAIPFNTSHSNTIENTAGLHGSNRLRSYAGHLGVEGT